ncbi:MAG: class I SAM-dependent methyltransferase [Pirellulales bacterium]|nr:class I SAM-dependent methyltransferase [Pirellulales bacterium]
MPQTSVHDDKLIRSARSLLARLADALDARVSVRLWDGTVVPLGDNADPDLFISISGPGVIGALLRRPTLENIVAHYARGQLDFHGTDLMTFIETLRVKNSRKRTRNISKWGTVRDLWPFLFVPAEQVEVDPTLAVNGNEQQRPGADNRALIQFHYDVGNDFYRLFLDDNMVYTCAYFTDWNNSLEQAQFDKLDMVCRKLQLKPGERLLDIGCGWGALVCHAVEHYGVEAHGVTLSQAQVDYAQQRISELGLDGRAKVELQDYNDVEGQYDKVSAIGIIEHVGIENIPNYFSKVRSLLPDRGIFLNHGITRPVKKSRRGFKRIRPEQRLLRKYIFPGGELDHIGHTIDMMETHGFRVHDVEGWRDHYALTCRHWCQRLWENRDEATRLVGRERFRLWLAYLGGVSLALGDGTVCLFQTVATKHASKGHSLMPPTRHHLYESVAANEPRTTSFNPTIKA